ncbi:MAG: GtrA family protein [Lentisphaeria bacterium]|nr:GtrA family protein [Lentisphaeria bacterium]
MTHISKTAATSWVAKIRKPLSFLLVGGFCFLFSLIAMIIQVDGIGLTYLTATAITWVVANGLGFVLNKRITFKTPGRAWKGEMVRYFLVMGTSFTVSMTFMYLAVDILGCHYITASIALAICMLGLNYLLHNAWSFGKNRG